MQNFNSLLTKLNGGIPPTHKKSDPTKKGRSRCYGCLCWVQNLGSLVKSDRLGVIFGFCISCARSFQVMIPGLQNKFARKCERNIENVLGVRNG